MSGGLPTREELDEQRAFLLASLDDLDGEWAAGDIEPADYDALKADHTARLAAVLRTIDRLDGKVAAGVPARSSRPTAARRSRWTLVASGLVTVAVAVGAGLLVTRTSGERLAGDPATGGQAGATAAAPGSAVGAEVAELLDQAFTADEANDVVTAVKLYNAVLEKDPTNVIAMAAKGWVLGRAKDPRVLPTAQQILDRAVEVDPTYAPAHAYRGLVLIANRRPGEAVCELRTYLSVAPPGDVQNRSVEIALEEATRQAGGNIPDCFKPIQPAPGQPGAPTTGGPTP